MEAERPIWNNQYTKAAEEGREPPKGTNQYIKGTRKRMDPEQRDKIRAEMLAQRLHAYVMGEPDPDTGEIVELDGTKVAAAKVLIDKGKPNLNSVDSMTVAPPLPESEILASIADLVRADPALQAQLRSLLDGVPTVVPTPQTGPEQVKDAA